MTLLARAQAYCSTLYPGATIRFDTDLEVVRPILHLLGGLLYKRNLRLAMADDLSGWVVVENEPIETNGIVATVVDRKPVDYAVVPVTVPLNPVLDFDDVVIDVRCRKCPASFWRCAHVSSVTLAKFDEALVSPRGGQA